ncbi:MAG TPA: ROK family protein [Acidobacteriota bacterium]|jgi:glucokinase
MDTVRQWVVATDVGGTKIATAVVSSSGERLCVHEENISRTGLEASLDQLVRSYQRATAETTSAVMAWGLAVPGIWDPAEERVWAPNVPGWDWIPLRRLLTERLTVPVFIESDRNASLMGEAWLGCARDCINCIYLIIGTGIGMGVMCDGRTVSGAHSVAGAVGWFILPALFGEKKIPLTWEEAAAGPALSRRYADVSGRREEPRSIFDRARQGENEALEVVRQTATYIGLGLCNLIAAFDPELIVFGGGMRHGLDLMEPTIRRTIELHAQPVSGKKVRLAGSDLGYEASLLGAARVCFEGLKVERGRSKERT